MVFLQKSILRSLSVSESLKIENGISFNFVSGIAFNQIIIALEEYLKLGRKTNPICFMKYLFLNADRINCFSFFNEISKRIFIYPIYTFGCYRSSYHGVFPTFCANRFPLTKHLLGLINFTILGFQQEVLTGQFDDTFHGWFSAVIFLLAFVFIVNTLSILVCSRKRRWDGLWPHVSLVILTNVSVYLRSEVIVCFSLLQKKDFGMGEVR